MRTILAIFATLALGMAAGTALAADPPPAAGADKKHDDAHGKDSAKPHAQPNIMELKYETAIWTFVVFLLLFFILSKYAWTPILEGLKARETTIANVMEEAKRLREENARDAAKFKAELDSAFAKIPAMMDEARKNAADLKEQIRVEGNAEVQKERQRLLREIDIARDQALQEIWSQAANVATLIATKVVGRSMTGDDHRRLVDEALDELKRRAPN